MSIEQSMIDFYLNLFQKGDAEQLIPVYCTLEIPRQIFLHKYKSLPPIEGIPEEEKIEWRKFVNNLFPGFSQSFRLDAIRIIYCLGTLTN